MNITIEELKRVWEKKARSDKVRILNNFNEDFGLRADNSVRCRLGKLKKRILLTDKQFDWFVREFKLQ